MSRSWTEKELKAASDQMKKLGHMSYDEFCKYLKEKQKEVEEISNKGIDDFNNRNRKGN